MFVFRMKTGFHWRVVGFTRFNFKSAQDCFFWLRFRKRCRGKDGHLGATSYKLLWHIRLQQGTTSHQSKWNYAPSSSFWKRAKFTAIKIFVANKIAHLSPRNHLLARQVGLQTVPIVVLLLQKWALYVPIQTPFNFEEVSEMVLLIPEPLSASRSNGRCLLNKSILWKGAIFGTIYTPRDRAGEIRTRKNSNASLSFLFPSHCQVL